MVEIFPEKLLNSISLKKDKVDIWCVSLDMGEDSFHILYGFLSKEERQKADSLQFPFVREKYVTSRGLLRGILALYVHTEPGDLQFSYGVYGKPGIPHTCDGLEITFNMSHSNGLALYGVGLGLALGVDIEKIRENMAFLDISKRFFSENEYDAIKKLPSAQIKEGFFNCWTRKEAYVKAKGVTLASLIGRFEVSLAPGAPAEMLAHEADPLEKGRWSFMDLDVGMDFRAALVVEGAEIQPNRIGDKIIRL